MNICLYHSLYWNFNFGRKITRGVRTQKSKIFSIKSDHPHIWSIETGCLQLQQLWIFIFLPSDNELSLTLVCPVVHPIIDGKLSYVDSFLQVWDPHQRLSLHRRGKNMHICSSLLKKKWVFIQNHNNFTTFLNYHNNSYLGH